MRKIYFFFLAVFFWVFAGKTFGQCLIDVALNHSSLRLCSGSALSIEGSVPTDGIYYYTWLKNDVVIAELGTSYSPIVITSVVVSDAAVYTLKVQDQLVDPQCTGEASMTLILDVPTVAGVISADQTICSGQTPATFVETTAASGGAGIKYYKWFSSTVGATGPWTALGAYLSAASAKVYAPGALTTTTYYMRRDSSAVCPGVNTNTITISVTPPLTSGVIGSSQTICYNAMPAALKFSTAPTGGSETYAYQWEQSTNGTTWWNANGTSTNSTYAPGPLTVDTWYRARIISASCVDVNTAPIKITVYPDLTSGTIGSAQTICYNSNPTAFTQLTAPTGSTGIYTYQWESSTTSATAGFAAIASATNSTYTSGALTANTYFRRTVTSGTCGSRSSSTIFVTVNPQVTAGTIGAPQSICSNTTPLALMEISAPTGGSGVYIYEWEQSANATIWSRALGTSTNATYAPGSLATTTYYRRRVVSGTCPVAVSNAVVITILLGLNPGTIGSDQTICYNTTPASLSNISSASGGTDTYAYQWESSTGTNTFTDIPGATNASYSPGTLTVTTAFARVVTSGTGTCSRATTEPVTITVSNSPVVGIIGSSQNICEGTIPVTLTSVSEVIGNYTYQWESATDLVNPIWSEIPDATGSFYSPGAITTLTAYRRKTSSACGNVVSNQVNIVVTPSVKPGAIGNSQTICEGETPAAFTSLSLASGGNGAYEYYWEKSTNDGKTWTSIPDATDVTYTSAALEENISTAQFRRGVSSGTGECSSAASLPVTIRITRPSARASFKDTLVCAGKDIVLKANEDHAGSFSYEWLGSGLTNANSQVATLHVEGYSKVFVKVIDQNSGCVMRDTVSVRVVSIAPITIGKLGFNCPDNIDNEVTLYVNGIASNYIWYKDNVPLKNDAVPLVTREPGEYYAVKNYGCSYSVSNKITLLPCTDYVLIKGKVFDDLNNNKTIDAGEKGVNQSKLICNKGIITYTDSLGNYTFYANPGEDFSFQVIPSNTVYSQVFPVMRNISVPNTPQATLSGYDFGIYTGLYKDLGVSLSSNGISPGFITNFSVSYYNTGKYPNSGSIDGTIKFNYPKEMEFVSSSLEVISHDIQNCILEVAYSNLTKYASGKWIIRLQAPVSFKLGSQLTAMAEGVVNDGDDYLVNNKNSQTITVTSSLDPNDKTVYPAGTDLAGFIEKDIDLEYIIRFQNTGTDTAFTVIVRDTIDENLDITSLEMSGASHSYIISAKDRVISWAFYNILLPDDKINEPESHGFIKYRISQKQDIALGDEIRNKAAIYFDFNEPVITNETLNTIGEPQVLSVKHNASVKSVLVYPNPATSEIHFSGIQAPFGYEVADLAGNQVMKGTCEGSLNISGLERGMYFIKLADEKQVFIDKIIKD